MQPAEQRFKVICKCGKTYIASKVNKDHEPNPGSVTPPVRLVEVPRTGLYLKSFRRLGRDSGQRNTMKYKHLRKFVNRNIKKAKIKAKQSSDAINPAILNAWQRCRKALILKIKRDRKEGRSRKKARKIISSLRRFTSNVSEAKTALHKFSETYQEVISSWEAALSKGEFTVVSNPQTTRLTAPIFIER